MAVRLPMMLDRQTLFSYECRSCRSCCFDKVIHLSPYDIARIANHRKVSTTEVIAEFTTDAGTTLDVGADGACVFLKLRMRRLVDRPSFGVIASSDASATRAEGSRSLDMDPSVQRYCGAHGLDMPERVEDKLELHIRALHEWLDGLEKLPAVGET